MNRPQPSMLPSGVLARNYTDQAHGVLTDARVFYTLPAAQNSAKRAKRMGFRATVQQRGIKADCAELTVWVVVSRKPETVVPA